MSKRMPLKIVEAEDTNIVEDTKITSQLTEEPTATEDLPTDLPSPAETEGVPPPPSVSPPPSEDDVAQLHADYFLERLPHKTFRAQFLDFLSDQQVSEADGILAAMTFVIEQRVFAEVRRYFLNKKASAVPQVSACERCMNEMKPERPGQRFCCNACGLRAGDVVPAIAHNDECVLIHKEAA